MVGIFAHDGAEAVLFEIFAVVLAQMQHHPGAARGLAGGLAHGELAAAVGTPVPGMTLAGLAGEDVDLVRHHEGGIEADAELADQPDILLGVAGELAHELAGARAGDGAEIGHQIVAVHADAVVGDGEGARLFVDGEGDAQHRVGGRKFGLGQRRVAQAVAGVGGVGNQFAKKDFLFAVERVRDDIEQPAHLGLEAETFFGHTCAPFLNIRDPIAAAAGAGKRRKPTPI